MREGFDIPANPVFGTNRPAEPKSRQRVLTDRELAEIWFACRDDDHGRIIKLLALTGQRRDEVGGMCWSEIDEDKKLWTIPGSRTKNHREHIIPLSDSALALVAASPRRTDRDYVFGDGPVGTVMTSGASPVGRRQRPRLIREFSKHANWLTSKPSACTGVSTTFAEPVPQ